MILGVGVLLPFTCADHVVIRCNRTLLGYYFLHNSGQLLSDSTHTLVLATPFMPELVVISHSAYGATTGKVSEIQKPDMSRSHS
jgi:hypothetical protein